MMIALGSHTVLFLNLVASAGSHHGGGDAAGEQLPLPDLRIILGHQSIPGEKEADCPAKLAVQSYTPVAAVDVPPTHTRCRLAGDDNFWRH